MSGSTWVSWFFLYFFFFQAEDGIRDLTVTGVQTCALPILEHCRRVERRFNRRIGLWSCALDSPIQRKQREKRFPISVKRIGHPFIAFCDFGVTLLPKRRILSKVFLPICLSKTRRVAQIRRKAGSAHFCS